MKYRCVLKMPARDNHGCVNYMRKIILEVGEANSPEHAREHMIEMLKAAWDPMVENIKPVGKKKRVCSCDTDYCAIHGVTP